MPINSFLYPAKNVPVAYEVANSCRFEDGDSAYMTRANAGSDGTPDTWTMSMWVKRSTLGTNQFLFIGNTSGNFNVSLRFNTSDQLYFYQEDHPAANGKLIMTTARKFRDISAWYHIVAQYDSTQSTNTNRAKIYINGVQETTFASTVTWPDQNFDSEMTSASTTIYIGRESGDSMYFDGYMAEVVLLDGTAATPTSFGEFDEDSPRIFKPIDVSGLTFGTHGFYLDFEDSSNLGNDVNGGTDFTENNLAATDQASDSPTNNFATYNSLQVQIGTANEPIFREGNLHIHGSTTGAIHFHAASTIGVTQGKWYAEFKGGSASNQNGLVGVTYDPAEDARNDDYPGQQSHSYAYFVNGNKYTGDSGTSYGDAWTTDIIGVALDLDNHKLYFSKNGTWQDSGDPTSGSTGTGSAYNLTTGKTYFFATGDGNATYVNPFEANFGGCSVSAISSGNSDANGYGNFEYAVPSGYYALCTKNLAEFG